MKLVVRSAKELGHAIKRFRNHKGLTQKDVADKFVLRQSTISEFENAEYTKKLDTLFMILSSLRLELSIQDIVIEDLEPDEW